MYTLYYRPEACSLATHTILNHLQVPFTLRHKDEIEDFMAVNPANAVPVLQYDDVTLTEGVAILLYLLERHDNTLLAEAGPARAKALEHMLFANASMHPAYNRLFFAESNIQDASLKAEFMERAAQAINQLWQAVEEKIELGGFLGGQTASPADILLTVYSRWGAFFPVPITIGARAKKMIEQVASSPEFQQALTREQKG